MKKDIEWYRGRLKELKDADLEMWHSAESNSKEQRHFGGHMAALDKAIDLLEELDEPEITETDALNKLAESVQFSAGIRRGGKMKKDKQWLKKEIENNFEKTIGYFDKEKRMPIETFTVTKKGLFDLIDQLNEPETPKEIKVIRNRLNNANDFEKEVNHALKEGYEFGQYPIVINPQTQDKHIMLFAWMKK